MAELASSPRGFRASLSGAPAASVALGPSLWTVFSWFGVALLLAAGAFSMYLIQVSSVATAGYELQRLETERQGWLARNEQLELELAKRRSLAWVEDRAVHRLGMVRVDRPTYVVVDQPPTPDPQGVPFPLAMAIPEVDRAAGDLDALRHWLVWVLRTHP